MNPSVSQVPFRELAKRNLLDLATIERDIFAVSFDNGKLVPIQPRYWDLHAGGTTSVFLGLWEGICTRPCRPRKAGSTVSIGVLEPCSEHSRQPSCEGAGVPGADKHVRLAALARTVSAALNPGSP
jgi:hypothetical protein